MSENSRETEEIKLDLEEDLAGSTFTGTKPVSEMTKAERRARKKLERQRKEENKSTAKVVFEYVRVILIGALIAFLLCKFVIINAEVPTGSMIPTINRGDRMIGLRLTYTFSKPKRGDVAIFKNPEPGVDYNKLFVKRVIGLPGEIVRIIGGEVYIITADGESLHLDETAYLYETPRADMTVNNREWVLADNEYFLMGDNRNGSHDCRFFGPVTEDRMMAKVIFKYYKGFEIFKNEDSVRFYPDSESEEQPSENV
ncbi:MAG: signal peptidase I [Butyrivibrio sp.]|nr:signal peptidase I [Butyrivibrio sp.]